MRSRVGSGRAMEPGSWERELPFWLWPRPFAMSPALFPRLGSNLRLLQSANLPYVIAALSSKSCGTQNELSPLS